MSGIVHLCVLLWIVGGGGGGGGHGATCTAVVAVKEAIAKFFLQRGGNHTGAR